MSEVLIRSAARTPFGQFGGAFKDLSTICGAGAKGCAVIIEVSP